MLLESYAHGQISRGNLEAAMAAREVRDKHGDLPRELYVESFSESDREALQKEGYIFTMLTGKSLREILGGRSWTTWHKNYPEFESLVSARSEIAVHPGIFLYESENKTLEEQARMISMFSQDISSRVRGVEAFMGEVADYAEIYSKIGDSFENNVYARTATLVPGSFAYAVFGRFNSNIGPSIERRNADKRSENILALPIIRPKSPFR